MLSLGAQTPRLHGSRVCHAALYHVTKGIEHGLVNSHAVPGLLSLHEKSKRQMVSSGYEGGTWVYMGTLPPK